MYSSKQMIVMRRDLKMRKGKIAAQAGHACVTATLMALQKEGRLGQVQVTDGWVGLTENEQEATPLSEWFDKGVAKICVYVDSEEELLRLHEKAQAAGVISALIQDAGMTEFPGDPPYPCLALEPLTAEKADEFTGGLPLY